MVHPTPQFTDADIINVEREVCKRSLSTFIKEAWPLIEPNQRYVHGWHVDALSDHLTAVTTGDIMRLLINIPPGTMKSMAVGVFWPAWEWGPRNLPYTRYLAASHSHSFSIRDNLRMRRLVASDWYQTRWPVQLTKDQNAKIKFENEKTGFREAMAMRSLTGSRGDRVILDDPHSVESAISDAERDTTGRIFKETVPTRLNNPDKSAIVIVMQRLHENDVSGIAIAEEMGYDHLMLPMEFEPERKCIIEVTGFQDPRTEEGELLFPERFPRDVVERDKKAMGSIAVAGQFQQRPAPRGGSMFKVDRIEIIKAAPKLLRTVRYWDKAGTQGGGKFSAGVKLGICRDGIIYVLDVVRGQWSALQRERVMRQTAELDGRKTSVWTEQEPGSGGKESAEATIRNMVGFKIYVDKVTGSKESRAEPLSAQVEAENIKMVEGSWNRDFIDEGRLWPNGKYLDQWDAASGAFNKIAESKTRDYSKLI